MEEFEYENPDFEIEPEMGFEEKLELWEMIFSKISAAVHNNHSFAVMFNMVPPGEDPDGGTSAVLDKSQFEVLLTNYLKWCEENELFERCSGIQKILYKHRGTI